LNLECKYPGAFNVYRYTTGSEAADCMWVCARSPAFTSLPADVRGKLLVGLALFTLCCSQNTMNTPVSAYRFAAQKIWVAVKSVGKKFDPKPENSHAWSAVHLVYENKNQDRALHRRAVRKTPSHRRAMRRQTGAHLHFRRRPCIWGHPYGLRKGRRGGISRNLVATPH
jgi:hypothetical protein